MMRMGLLGYDCACAARATIERINAESDFTLSPYGALCVDIKRINRRAAAHEEAVAVYPAEAQVRAALGQGDAADELRLAVEHVDAVERVAPHAPAHPQVAVDIDAKAVRRSVRLGGEEDAAVRKARAAVHHVVDADQARICACLDDVEPRFVGRERETVGPVHVARRDGEL